MKRALNWILDVLLGIFLLVFFWLPAVFPRRKPDSHEGAGV